MWNKIKGYFFSFLIGVVTIAGILFFRSRADGSGVSGDGKLDRDINDGIDRVQDGIKGTQGAIDGVSSDLGQGIKKTDDIELRLGNTKTKLQNALEILQRAKARANPD